MTLRISDINPTKLECQIYFWHGFWSVFELVLMLEFGDKESILIGKVFIDEIQASISNM